MRPPFEEDPKGNGKLKSCREKGAPLIALANTLTDPQRTTLRELYDAMYYKEALTVMLIFHHPSTDKMKLNKPDTINRLISANAGFPMIDKWVEMLEKVPRAKQILKRKVDSNKSSPPRKVASPPRRTTEDLSKAKRHD
jgi:hypothetical protein